MVTKGLEVTYTFTSAISFMLDSRPDGLAWQGLLYHVPQ